MSWIINAEKNESYSNCPVHDKDARCIVIAKAEDDTAFKVKLHGTYWIGADAKPFEFEAIDRAQESVDNMLAALDFKGGPPRPAVGTAGTAHAEKPINLTVDPYTYNMYQVMVQGTPHGPFVLVNSPRFGPLHPDQAINLAAWLRFYAQECGNLTREFDDIWETVKGASDGQ